MAIALLVTHPKCMNQHESKRCLLVKQISKSYLKLAVTVRGF